MKTILGPRESLAHLFNLQTSEDYEQAHTRYFENVTAQRPNLLHPTTRQPIRRHEQPVHLQAYVYVNHGRYLIDCECKAGVEVDLEWKLALCFGCGAVYREHHLVIPEHLLVIEAALAERKAENRNFDPRTETLEALQRGDV